MKNAKAVYAQSSDIKARSFREYRRDMKKKAIAELEFVPFLQGLLAPATVEKFGADAELWFFQQHGKITQEPDYRAVWPDGREFLYEFQYGTGLGKVGYFDFKVSKVGKKQQGKRVPHEDREFFYVVKSDAQYAFVSPRWIMENGKEGPVPAWGSRPAYRVPDAVFRGVLRDGGAEMARVISAVDDKNALLEFQDKFPDLEAAEFSRELQAAVDKRRLVKIMPKTLDGFCRVCFLLERMNESPESPGVWLVYLASFFRRGLSALQFARWMFCLDFLYFKCESLAENERRMVKRALADAGREIRGRAQANGSFGADPNAAPAEETRRFLFAVNLLEDVRQDFAVSYGGVAKARRIFEILPDFAKTAAFIREAADLPADP